MRFALVMVTVLFLLTSVGRAQSETEYNQLGLMLGAELIPAHSTTGSVPIRFSENVVYQLNFAHRMKGGKVQLWLEFPSAAAPSHSVASVDWATPVSLATFYTTPSLRVNMRGEGGVSPWILFGGGYALYEGSEELRSRRPNLSRYVNTGALQFGAGVDLRTRLRLLRPIGLRGEVRDFFSLDAPDFTTSVRESHQHNVIVSGGFIVRF